MTSPSQEGIAKLQMLEQQLQTFSMRRQQFHMQTIEIENALKELGETKEKPFKLVGSIMVQTDKEILTKELQAKQETLRVRIKSLEQQEEQFKKKAEKLQQDILAQLQKEGDTKK